MRGRTTFRRLALLLVFFLTALVYLNVSSHNTSLPEITGPATFHVVHTNASWRRTIIVGDVHGCYQELRELLTSLNFDRKQDRLVFTGDLVGKGPETQKVVQFALEVGALSVRGNHEEVFVRYYRAVVSRDKQIPLPRMLDSYLKIAKSFTPDQWRYILEMPLFLELPDMNSIVVHAGLVPGTPLVDQVSFVPPSPPH